MVRVQEPSAFPDSLLIGSDLSDSQSARREIETWAIRNGYRLPPQARHLAVIVNGSQVREWVLVEPRTPGPPRRAGLSMRFLRRPLAAVARFRKAA